MWTWPAASATGCEPARLGNRKLIEAAGLAIPASLSDLLAAEAKAGRTPMLVAHAGEVLGLVSVADRLKPGAAAALASLKASGLSVIMATGDSRGTAEAIASELGLDRIEAEMTPEAKHQLIADLRKAGKVVAFAGDGVNDAPALAAADVGIESAGITLLKGELDGILKARRLATAAMGNIGQNLAFAFGYNALGIPVAAGVLFPFTGWLLSPMLAAAAMALSSVSVISNALRLNGVKLEG